jgi:branched-chain amino acid transport system substrate-binding protein
MNVALATLEGKDAVRVVQLDVERINADGGLKLSADRYPLDLIVDDNRRDPAIAQAAAQKEMHEDGARFILGDAYAGSYLALADRRKVMVFASPASLEDYSPDYNFLVRGSDSNTTLPAMIAYVYEKFPALRNFLGVLPDTDEGHARGGLLTTCAWNAGMKKVQMLYYPADAADLSGLGAQIKDANPDLLAPDAGGLRLDGLVARAAYEAGYRGQLLGLTAAPGEALLVAGGSEATDGMLAWAWPAEFEPALGKQAQDFKAAYTAKYGKWDNPDMTDASQWWTLKSALVQAGSFDPYQVASTVFDGMRFDSPAGQGRMVRRHDLANERSIELAMALPIKKVKTGKVVQYDTTTPDQVFDYVKSMYGVHCTMSACDVNY